MKTNRENESDTFDIESDTNFTMLCQQTLAVCNISDFPIGTFSNRKNRWLELVISWETLLENGSVGIFRDAVHRIMWGIPWDDSKPEHEGIVRIVKEELLKDGEAFTAWDTYIACEIAITAVGNDMDPWAETDEDYRYSIEHYHYLWDRMLWKIRYSKEKYIAEYSRYREAITDYEAAIKKIAPASVLWDEEYWCNENHIFDELVNLYGVDYRDDYVEYGRILLILMNTNKNNPLPYFEEVWYASSIRKMPLSLANTIWPDDTKEELIDIFLLAAKAAEQYEAAGKPLYHKKDEEIHPVGIFEYCTLFESWLYTLMHEWFIDENSDNERVTEVKRQLFTIALNC